MTVRRIHIKRALARLMEAQAHLLRADLALDLAHESERDANLTCGLESLHARISKARVDARESTFKLEQELAKTEKESSK